jgi:hypothetical protein
MKKAFNLDEEIKNAVISEGLQKPSKDFMFNVMNELATKQKQNYHALIPGKLTVAIICGFFLVIASYLKVNRNNPSITQSPLIDKMNSLLNFPLSFNVRISSNMSTILICTLVLIIGQLIMIKRVLLK